MSCRCGVADVRYRNHTERELARDALALGWRLEERNGMGHLVARFPPTGARLPLPGDPGRRGLRNARAQLRRIAHTAARC